MADYDSSLPVRTQNDGDVVAKIADATVPSQQLSVDASGKIFAKLDDGAGNNITSQTNGGQRALDVRSQSNGPVTPGTVANFSDLVGGQFNSILPTLTDGQQAALQVDSSGRLFTHVSNLPTTVDTDYGVVGANTIRTASQIGNATGAANFNYGTVGAQTLRSAAQVGNATGAADFNFGAVGAQTLRSAAQVGNATGAADFNFGTIGAQSLRSAAQIGNATGAADFNFGTIGAQSLRVASQIGNATGAADFNNGATGAQTLRVAANLAVGGANVSATNPVPVTISVDSPGTEVNDYQTNSAVAAGASSNHDYTVTALKTLLLTQINASASGKAKIEVQIETGVATGIFTSKFVQFNSTATPNMGIELRAPIAVAAGVRVRIIRTNKDNQSQDLYSTISGQETP